MLEEEVRQTHTLNCDGCGGVIENSSAFPQPQLCPECLEPEADESKDLEMSKQVWKFFLKAHADECDTDAVVDHIVSETASIKDLECQKRVERLFEEIEANSSEELRSSGLFQVVMTEEDWQDLKKRQGVK